LRLARSEGVDVIAGEGEPPGEQVVDGCRRWRELAVGCAEVVEPPEQLEAAGDLVAVDAGRLDDYPVGDGLGERLDRLVLTVEHGDVEALLTLDLVGKDRGERLGVSGGHDGCRRVRSAPDAGEVHASASLGKTGKVNPARTAAAECSSHQIAADSEYANSVRRSTAC
jgi:hypothetical protein